MSTPTTTWGRHRGSARTDRKGRRVLSRRMSAFGALTLVVTGGTVALADVTVDNHTNLKAVGPISGEHGYPTWYQDANNVRLEQCLDILDEYCDPVFLRGEMPNPDAPVSFPDNWPLESFYFLAGSEFDTTAGKAVLTAGLEATMANEATQDGDQVVFGRLRFDIDFPDAGTYVVTHPYGVDTFNVDAAGDFRYVEDITPAPGNFSLALGSRISPFLVDADGMHELPNGNKYVGNPGELTTVTGSPHETNYFKIEKKNDDGTTTLIGQSDQFSLMGKVSTNSGITPNAATLVENADGTRYLDVFGITDAGEAISVQGTGLVKTLLDAEGGRYFGRLSVGDTVPAEVTFVNDSDRPVATKKIKVTDGVTISSATYDTASDELTVTAASTDQVDPPALTLDGFMDASGAPVTIAAGGTATVTTTAAPAFVTVKSAGGGSDSAPVTVNGGVASQPVAPMAVIAGPATVVADGNPITITNASLNATTGTWTQLDGPPLGIDGSTASSISVPTVVGEAQTYVFQLDVVGPNGTATTTYRLEVLAAEAPTPAPTAVAESNVTEAYLGQMVTLSASKSTGAASYQWAVPEGVTLSAGSTADQANISFPMPASSTPLTFTVTVTGADGQTAKADVSVSQIVDQLTAGGEFRASKTEWRLNGTASVTATNTVRVYVQNADGSKGAQIGSASVDALGAWSVRAKGSPAEGASRRVIVESTRGGYMDNVSYTRR